MKNDNWKKFERLVAAVHLSDDHNSTVKWNDIIDGRQFDVTIRFSHGLHDYLTVIECKKESRRVEISDVEAFVTKSHDAGASKAIIVSATGFQQGCIPVAQKHGIVLLSLGEAHQHNQVTPTDEIIPAMNVYNLKFIKSNGHSFRMPTGPGGILEYLMMQGKIEVDGKLKTPNALIRDWQVETRVKITEAPTVVRIPFGRGSKLFLPERKMPLPIAGIEFTYKLIKARKSTKGNLDLFIQDQLARVYTLTSIVGGKSATIPFGKVVWGFDTELKEDSFYENPVFGFYYYCEKIDSNTVSMVLVESFQNGSLIQGGFTFDKKYQRQYVIVTDEAGLKRLRKRLVKLRKTRATNRIHRIAKAAGDASVRYYLSNRNSRK